MPLYRITDSAILSYHIYHLPLKGIHGRTRIVMDILNISAQRVISSGSLIYQPCRVEPAGQVHCDLRIKLAPGLVERHPHCNTLKSFQSINDVCPFPVIILFPFLRHLAICPADETVSGPHIGLVLYHLIATIIKPTGITEVLKLIATV